MREGRALVCTVALMGCARSGRWEPPSSPDAKGIQRFGLEVGSLKGFSGLAWHSGSLYAVPERDRFVARFELREGKLESSAKSVPLLGVPAGLDTEALAFFADGRLLIGTEGRDGGRKQDLILFATLEASAATVVEIIAAPYDLLEMEADGNRGIEGICSAGQLVFAVSESVREKKKKKATKERLAPFWRYVPETRQWSASWVRLTSDEGKLAGLSCRLLEDGGVELIAIERHFEVSRILSFVLQQGPLPERITPLVLIDLAGRLARDGQGNIPNLEGLERVEGSVWLITDNDFGGSSGPTQLLKVDLTIE